MDHGYGNIKTAHRVFTTGVEAYDEKPIVSTNFVKYREKYYVIGESHLVYQGNKTDSDDFYILTLAGLAEELKFRGLHEAEVVLAVGLPLAWVKSQSADWRAYLMQEKELDFMFQKERYKVHLCGVEIFPQGLAAVHNQGAMPGMNMLVDIGNGTMSILEIHDGRPIEKSISTEVFGVHHCMEKIQKELSKRGGVEVPKLDKVVINMGVGEAKENAKVLESAVADLEKIAGQKAVLTRAKNSVANFKIREGMPIGCKVTLRGERMYEFVDRLINLALPRVRDFRGVNPNAFDGRGNYALGIKEQLIFPEIEYDKVDKVRGMDVIFVTTAKTDEEARELLTQFNMPFTK